MKLKLILTMAMVGTVLALPSASSAQAPTQDSVTSQAGFPYGAYLDASSGPLGENPTGVVSWHEGGGGYGPTWSGDVSCLSASGNVAIIGFGDGDHRSSIPLQHDWIAGLIRVVDNGPGLDDTFEWVELQTVPVRLGDPLPGPTDCSSFPPGGFQILPLDQNPPESAGDIVVTDAQPPLPTSREPCKYGGWRDFSQFKNQGQCVAFVQRGPGPQEASGTG